MDDIIIMAIIATGMIMTLLLKLGFKKWLEDNI